MLIYCSYNMVNIGSYLVKSYIVHVIVLLCYSLLWNLCFSSVLHLNNLWSKMCQ